MRILTLISLLFVFGNLNGQINFYKLYSGNGYDKGEGIVQLEDSSYVITGSSSSWEGSSQAFLLKIDSLGNYKWSNQYGGPESEEGKRVLYNKDLGFYIAGFSNSFGTGDFNAYLVNTDVNGIEQWHKTYGKPSNWERINDAVMTLDSGIVMVGEVQPMNGESSDVLIIRTDKNGDTLWIKQIGGNGQDAANTIVKFNNNYLIGGQWFIPDSNMVKGFVIQMNDQGIILDFDTVSHKTGNYYINDIAVGYDRYYVVGNRNFNGIDNDFYRVFLNNGSIFSQYTFENNGAKAIVNQLAYIPHFDRVATGYQVLNSGTFQDDFDIGTAYFSSDYLYFLNPDFAASIYNVGLDKFNDLIPTNDGAYIAVGFNTAIQGGNSVQNGGTNIFAIKIGPDDVFPNTSSLTFGQLVGIEIVSEELRGKIYPNPFKDEITIEVEGNNLNVAELINIQGITLKKFEFQNQITIPDSQLPQGTYFMKIGSSVTKIIKAD